MSKEIYNGLSFVFIPLNNIDITAQSGCTIISVQYYVNGQIITGQCNPEEGSYNVNWQGEWG